ncbi:MAG: hypothetical protein N2235_03860 [Fischerella sp.]|nr:hypothetical protein [Fischerella sp.]
MAETATKLKMEITSKLEELNRVYVEIDQTKGDDDLKQEAELIVPLAKPPGKPAIPSDRVKLSHKN